MLLKMNELTRLGRALLLVFVLILLGVDILIFYGAFGQAPVIAWPRVMFGVLFQLLAVPSFFLVLSMLRFSSVTSSTANETPRPRLGLRVLITGVVVVAVFAGSGWSLIHSGVVHGDQVLKQRGQL